MFDICGFLVPFIAQCKVNAVRRRPVAPIEFLLLHDLTSYGAFGFGAFDTVFRAVKNGSFFEIRLTNPSRHTQA